MLTPTRYRCLFTVLDQFSPPEYLGSTWRGVLGHALRRVLCVKPPRTACPEPVEWECVKCELRARCLYPLFYDHPLLPEDFAPGQMQDPPRPFVLEPDPTPHHLRIGDSLGLNLVLFGETADWLPAFVRGFAELTRLGLGVERARVRLEEIWQQDNSDPARWHPVLQENGDLQPGPLEPIQIPAIPAQVRLELYSPLRLRRDGEYLTPGKFTFNDLAQHLYRRLILLNRLYGDSSRHESYPPLPPVHGELSRDLEWIERERHSNRQKRKVQMGGLSGYLILDGQALALVWEYLWLGQWFHVGSGTALGLGQYHLTPSG